MNLPVLADEQACECFRLAFGDDVTYCLSYEIMRDDSEGKVEISAFPDRYERLSLSIWPDGSMAATGYVKRQGVYSPTWYPFAVVKYLEGLVESSYAHKVREAV